VAPALGWRVAVGAIWLLAVFLAYYAVHKPFTAADLEALRTPALGASWQPLSALSRALGGLADVCAALALLLLAGAIGHVLWRALRLPAPERAEARLVSTVLGLGVLGLAAFLLALLGLATRPAAFALLGLPALVLFRDALGQARWWAGTARAWWHAGWGGGAVDRVAVLFSACTLALVFLAALLPPTTAWDALSYHLVSARADAAAGHIVLDPANPQLYQPQLTESLYTLLLLVRGGDGPAALFHAGCGVIAVVLVGLLGWRLGGPRIGVRAAALALAIPTLALLASWPYVDLTLAAADLAALATLPLWQAARRRGDRRAARGWLVAAALAAGVGLDIKYTAAYGLLAFTLLVAFVAWRERRLPTDLGGQQASVSGAQAQRIWPRLLAGLRPAALFAAVALAVGSVWPLRNLLVAGDPFFPYHLGPLFPGGPDWDAGRTAFMQGHGWGITALWHAPLLLLETTLLGRQGTSEFDATLGPLLLVLLPLGLLSLRFPSRGAAISVAAAAKEERTPSASIHERAGSLIFWCVGFAGALGVLWSEELARSGVAMQSRLFLPLFLALAPPAASAWVRLDALRVPAVSLGRLVGVAAAICFALTVIGQAVQTLQLDNLAELAGAQSRDAYLAQQLGPYATAMQRLDSLGPHARVLLLWEPRSYLTHARVAPDMYLDRFNLLYRRCGDVAGITRCLRAQGYTHVLVYQQGLRLLRAQPGGKDPPAELATLDALLHDLGPAICGDTVPLVGAGPPGKGWYSLYTLGGVP
jgi:Dolichyl-phosphate-mannose-protein mannosyltransferase